MNTKTPTFSVIFYIITKKVNHKGEAPIYARITVDGVREFFSIKRTVLPSRWSSKGGIVNGNKEDARSLNHYITTVREKIFNLHDDFTRKEKIITARGLKEAYLGIGEKKMTLLELFNSHNRDLKAQIGTHFAKATYTRYETTLEHVKKFLVFQYKIRDINLVRLNYKFVTDFEFYLKTQCNCNHNTTLKYIRNLKKIVIIAVANDWLDKDPFLKFKSTLKEVERIFLTSEELKAIENKYFSIIRLDQVRDIFTFCSYTGLSFSDVSKLSQDHIVTGIDGGKWIMLNRTKTQTKSRIPLLPKAIEIIHKYENDPECIYNKKLLPVKSNQKFNAYLKEIADLCGITKNLSAHSARHTFSTTVTLTNGVPIETVSLMLGHKNIRTTQIYAKVVDKKLSEDMQALKKKINRQNLKEKKRLKKLAT